MTECVYISEKINAIKTDDLINLMDKIDFKQIFLNSCMFKDKIKIQILEGLLSYYRYKQVLFIVCVPETDDFKFYSQYLKHHDMQLSYNIKSNILSDVQYIKRKFLDIEKIHYICIEEEKDINYNYVNYITI